MAYSKLSQAQRDQVVAKKKLHGELIASGNHVEARKVGAKVIATEFGISRSMIYRYMKNEI